MKTSPWLASGLALAVSAAEAQTPESSAIETSFAANITVLNEAPPQALVDLQQCVRNRFAAFGLQNSDGTTSYMFEQSHGEGTLTYDFTFPPDLADLNQGETYLSTYKQLPLEIFQDQVVSPEDPDFNINFEYPIGSDTLLNNGYISHPADFVSYFQNRLKQWSFLCRTDRLTPVDLPAMNERFWTQANEIHNSARAQIEACLEADLTPQTKAVLYDTLSRFGALEQYREHGFEDPYEMTYELERAAEQYCPDSKT
jgi:hypothetical protein